MRKGGGSFLPMCWVLPGRRGRCDCPCQRQISVSDSGSKGKLDPRGSKALWKESVGSRDAGLRGEGLQVCVYMVKVYEMKCCACVCVCAVNPWQLCTSVSQQQPWFSSFLGLKASMRVCLLFLRVMFCIYTSVYTCEVCMFVCVGGSLALAFSWLMSLFRACEARHFLVGFKAVPKMSAVLSQQMKKQNKTKITSEAGRHQPVCWGGGWCDVCVCGGRSFKSWLMRLTCKTRERWIPPLLSWCRLNVPLGNSLANTRF